MDAWIEGTETHLERKESTPVEMANIGAHPDVPNEQAEVETVRVLEDRYGNRPLAIGRHQPLKKQTQSDGGSQKKLATSCRWPTVPFLHCIRDTVIRATQGQCCKRSL
jgi:hypothetical protein